LDAAEAARLAGAPTYPEPDGRVKVPAAWLVEQAGFAKGSFDGPVGISTKHSLALVNRGGGRTADLLRVARTIRDGVWERFGIELLPEPVLVGTTL
jgi:UDP-N-acetylmuramate dehydrogenase